jgi:molecular chaperone GrpE
LTKILIFYTLFYMSKIKNLKKLSNLKNNQQNQNNPSTKTTKTPVTEIKPDTKEVKPQVNISSKLQPEQLNPESNVSKNAEIEILKVQLNSKVEESKDWQNKAFRYVADLENYKKQQELELAQAKKNTKKNAIKPLLEFLNNQYLSLNFIKDITDEKSQKAFAAFNSSFEKIIVEYKLQGVDLILPQPGDTFDPVTMQALTPSTDEEAVVKHIVSLGLKVDNQLIQPVMVVL